MIALGLGAWAWARWRPSVVEIRGDSMTPTLRAGDLALVVRVRSARRGWVVVARSPERPGLEIVKRVTAGPGDLAPDGRVLGPRECWVEGDAPASSTDSRRLGPLDLGDVRGRVLAVCWPPSRWSLVGSRRPALPTL
ncbi:MAG: hypothetical protein KatS3mg014_0518 [Actinomycetota bacterium]|nr:MAG: hypothetical protein KatS3mg014_0518 [Actinomycetota bacterium]